MLFVLLLSYRYCGSTPYTSCATIIEYPKKADELYGKLEGLKIPRLKELHLKKIIDVMPKSAKEVKVVLQGYTVTVKQEHLKKIADTVAEFAPKK